MRPAEAITPGRSVSIHSQGIARSSKTCLYCFTVAIIGLATTPSYAQNDQFVVRMIPGVTGGSTDVSTDGFIAFTYNRWRVSSEELQEAASRWCTQFESGIQFVSDEVTGGFSSVIGRRVSTYQCVDNI